MWIILIVVVSVATAAHHDHYHHNRNQRIIKVHSSPYKSHPHHKHIRPGPLGPHVHYHDHDEDYHYEYIRPARPPPIPPFVSGPPLSSASKYQQTPGRAPSFNSYKSYGSPYKSPNNFRSSPVKDHFRGASLSPPSFPPKPVSPPSFEYLPSLSSAHNHVINSDDNRGPIHEIPAPNLGPKPNHIEGKPFYSPPSQHEIAYSPPAKQHEINFSPPSNEHKIVYSSPTKHENVATAQHSYEPKPAYEVVESNDKIIESSDGSKGYYAPDPDPSLPAPKLTPTHDPHSTPSRHVTSSLAENQNFPTGQEYQLVEAGPDIHAPIPNLSSQELFDLMHSFPNDQYTLVQATGPGSQPLPPNFVTLLASQPPYQPQPTVHSIPNYISSTPNSHQEIENNGIHHQTSISHEQLRNYGVQVDDVQQNQPQQPPYHDFNHPHFQTFNYEENNPNAAAVPMENPQTLFRYEEDASGSDSESSPQVVRNVHDKKKPAVETNALPSDLTNLIPDDEYESALNKDQDQSPIFKINAEVPFYSSLPNKETAEAFATLQAAGSVASNINKLRGDQPPEEDAEDPDPFFGLPKHEISKPHLIHTRPNDVQGQILVSHVEDEENLQGKKTEKTTVEVQKSVPLYEATIKSKSLVGRDSTEDEILASLDVGQGAVSERFGRKIRPKN